jgi:hypothetical protein
MPFLPKAGTPIISLFIPRVPRGYAMRRSMAL